MSNILWIQPNKTLALTNLVIDTITPQDHAQELIIRGDVPNDWTIAAYNVDYPNDYPHKAYRWDGEKIVLDEIALNEINAKNANPTKEQLLSELQALTEKIASLEIK
jgi:hypothetical protein